MDNKRIHGKRKRITVSKFNHLRTYTSVNAKYNAIEQPKLSDIPELPQFIDKFEAGIIESAEMVLPRKLLVSIETALTEKI